MLVSCHKLHAWFCLPRTTAQLHFNRHTAGCILLVCGSEICSHGAATQLAGCLQNSIHHVLVVLVLFFLFCMDHTDRSQPVGLFPMWPVGTHGILQGENRAGTGNTVVRMIFENMAVILKIRLEFQTFAEAERLLTTFVHIFMQCGSTVNLASYMQTRSYFN